MRPSENLCAWLSQAGVGTVTGRIKKIRGRWQFRGDTTKAFDFPLGRVRDMGCLIQYPAQDGFVHIK